MNNIQVMLSEEQSAELKKYIFQITMESIEQAQRNAGLDKPFLKQKYMAEYLGISVNTLKDWQRKGLPTIVVDGVVMYSKEEVSKWLLQQQK